MDKQAIRERVWDELEEQGQARFPFPPHGRIPNFAGADDAAERVTAHEAWQDASTIKANPDSPQRPVRRRALAAGKTVYMAVPRLRDEECFLRLDPAVIDDYDHATTINGSAEAGEQVHPDEMAPIDFVVSGSVAVTDEGSRIGKGEGYSDLEFAVLREYGLVDDGTTTATTVHEIQVVDDEVTTAPHDVSIDLLVTPGRTVRDQQAAKPEGIRWEKLDDDRIAEIPILAHLRGET
jgi:5-formyltetrahydrofolate cyclo-ligase